MYVKLTLECTTLESLVDKLKVYIAALTTAENDGFENVNALFNYLYVKYSLESLNYKLALCIYDEAPKSQITYNVWDSFIDVKKELEKNLDKYNEVLKDHNLRAITYDDYIKREKIIASQKYYNDTMIRYEENRLANIKKREDDRFKREEEARILLERQEQQRKERLTKENERKIAIIEYYNKTVKYYKRCAEYIRWGFDSAKNNEYSDDNENDKDKEINDDDTDPEYPSKIEYSNINEVDISELEWKVKNMKDTITEAHKKYNESLLEYTQHDGCSAMGIDCSDDCFYCSTGSCYWVYGNHRCICDNFKGFSWSTEGVDWLEDITLDSSQYLGHQERMW